MKHRCKLLHWIGYHASDCLVNSFISCDGSGCAHDRIIATVERKRYAKESIAKEKAEKGKGKEHRCYFYALSVTKFFLSFH
jgi:hypothetical protein